MFEKNCFVKSQNPHPMSSRDAVLYGQRHVVATSKSHRGSPRRSLSSIQIEEASPREKRVSPRMFACVCLGLVLTESVLNFATFAFTGLALKWDLTFGDEAPHRHPHVPEENYIQRPNNLLSIIMVSTSFNFAEAIVLLVFYCVNANRRRKALGTPAPHGGCYRALRGVALFYSGLCILLSGANLATCLALQLNLHPPDLRFIGCEHPSTCTLVCSSPQQFAPPPPPPVSPVLPTGEVYLLYVLCAILALLKLSSYALGIPFSALEWKFKTPYHER